MGGDCQQQKCLVRHASSRPPSVNTNAKRKLKLGQLQQYTIQVVFLPLFSGCMPSFALRSNKTQSVVSVSSV